MSEWIESIRERLRWALNLLTPKPMRPKQRPFVGASRDRSLPGKARIRARRLGR